MRKVCLAILLASVLAGLPAAATTITYTGVGKSPDGLVNGEAIFNLSKTGFTLKLENLQDPVTASGQLLTNLEFSLSVKTGADLESATTSGFVSCPPQKKGTPQPCTITNSTTTDPGAFGWTVSGIGDLTLAAGAGSFKPDGIFTDGATSAMGTDGLGNAQHNPFLLGPVTFNFKFPAPLGSTPLVNSANFSFGTGPFNVKGKKKLPEPASLLLLGVGLLGLGTLMRRYRE